MTIQDLSRDQLVELKQAYISGQNSEKNCGTSYGELADADKIVPDSEIFALFGDVEFSVDDFVA